jgi:hypothetical protein
MPIPVAARTEIEKAASGARIQKVEAVSENGKSFFEAVSVRQASRQKFRSMPRAKSWK